MVAKKAAELNGIDFRYCLNQLEKLTFFVLEVSNEESFIGSQNLPSVICLQTCYEIAHNVVLTFL